MSIDREHSGVGESTAIENSAEVLESFFPSTDEGAAILRRARRDAEPEVREKVVKIEMGKVIQYWESEATRPKFGGASNEMKGAVEDLSKISLDPVIQHPFQSPEKIRAEQFARIQYLVDLAYREVPVYRAKYDAAGFKPADLKTWQDFERVPVVTKDDFIGAGVDNCITRQLPMEELFCTRSFGTSGKTLPIRVDPKAILIDTLQGVRQFWLHSGMKYASDHLTAMIYTVPWWLETVGNEYPSAFISNLIDPETQANLLNELQPHVVSCYPTNLRALIPFLDKWDRRNLHTAVVHSEGSTAEERKSWAKAFGVPVFDEYSSEEGTRMALELPCGHYHVCDDAVYLEVLNSETFAPQKDGEAGLTVITNLLNEGMPFIRYVQGDYVERPAKPAACGIGWSQLATLKGRVNDSFLNLNGRSIPAGSILDVTYRWMFDSRISVNEFEIIQKAPDIVQATFAVGGSLSEAKVRDSLPHFEVLLQICLGHPVKVVGNMVPSFSKRAGKRRLIRREFTSPLN